VKYNETNPFVRSGMHGNWGNGYFLELFAEYSTRFGSSEIGIFGRWNGLEDRSTVNVDLFPPTPALDRDFSLTRYSWTFGASFSLAFNVPL